PKTLGLGLPLSRHDHGQSFPSWRTNCDLHRSECRVARSPLLDTHVRAGRGEAQALRLEPSCVQTDCTLSGQSEPKGGWPSLDCLPNHHEKFDNHPHLINDATRPMRAPARQNDEKFLVRLEVRP